MELSREKSGGSESGLRKADFLSQTKAARTCSNSPNLGSTFQPLQHACFTHADTSTFAEGSYHWGAYG